MEDPVGLSQPPQEDMLDDDVNADKNIPKTIHTVDNPDDEHRDTRAQQVVSPDGTSTYDGTSTIGSATSEPTTETASRTSRASQSKASHSKPSRKKSSSSRSKMGGRSGTSSSSGQASSNGKGGRSGTSGTSGRSGYRSSHYGSSRVQQGSVPRPFKRAGPLSYSRTVKLSGAGSPFSGREVDDKTRAVLADMNEFDANQAETE